MNRRQLLKGLGGAGVAWLAQSFGRRLPLMVFSQERLQTDVLVVVFQRGGMDGLSAVIPYFEGERYYDRRPTLGVRASGEGRTALDLDGKFALHPSLEPLKDIYNEGHLGIIHATGSPDPTRSHFDAMTFMEQGTPGDRMTATGWINRHLQTVPWENDSPFRAVGMGTMVQTSLRGPVSALALQSISDFHLSGRDNQIPIIQRTLAQLYDVPNPQGLLEISARETLETVNFLQRLSDRDYSPAEGVNYPGSEYGNGLRQVAQLIKADVGLEVACVDIGGWDTHEEQGGSDGRIAELFGHMAQGLNAFYTDLQEHMNRITVVTMSEFGRRLEENGSQGTDHGHGNCMFVMGGGVKKGVHTRWPGLHEEALDRGDLAITTDYRDVLSELLTKRLANNKIAEIFPGYSASALDIFKALT